MRRLILIAAAAAVVLARPETYRETEDFNYSRSSNDEGTKSGFYAAQRGNMGGNYEKAHNMDTVAQNQMGTAITSVQGELGEAEKVPTGSVYTSGNTRGVYGHGLHSSVLQGRNFNEGASHADSLSHSSLSSMNSGYDSLSQASQQNSRYSGGYAAYNTKNSGYTGYRTRGSLVQAQNNQEALDQISASNSHYGQHNSQGSVHTNMDYGGYNSYDQSQFNRHNSQSRYGLESDARQLRTSNVPVRIVIRPGSTVNVPVSAQSTSFVASTHDQNAIVSDAELLSNADNQHISSYKPKSYESSYSYRKQWEKHSDSNADSEPSAVPLAIPTLNPYPKNSELLEDAHGSLAASHGYQGSTFGQTNHYAGYNAAHESARSQYDAGYNAHQTKTASALSNGYNSGAYNRLDSNADLSKLVSAGTVPKQYESSYSYHKSWERQGDPYVIEPVSGGTKTAMASQRLRAATTKHSSHSGYSQNALDCDCDEEGHARVVRSADGGQQTIQLENLEDFGQQVQDKWHMEDFGQQSEDQWHSSDLTQETQQLSKLEDFGQQTQDLSQTKEFGQKPQNKWDLEDLQQQSQKQSDKIEDLGQQTQDKWDNLHEFTQQSQNLGRFDTQTQDGKFNYDKQPAWDLHANTNDKSNGFFQHSQSRADGFSQQTQGNIDRTEQSSQRNTNNLHNQGTQHGQQNSAHDTGRSYYDQHTYSAVKPVWEQSEEGNKDLMPLWDKINNLALQSSATATRNGSWSMDSQHAYQSWEQQSGSSQSTYYNNNDRRVGAQPWDWSQGEKLNNKTTTVGITVPDFEPGRGDIGADYNKKPITDKNSPEMFFSQPPNSYHKQNKTPEEIEALSLTKETNASSNINNQGEHDLSVVGINSQSGRHSVQQSNTEQLTQQATNEFEGPHDNLQKNTQGQETEKHYGYGIDKLDHNSQQSSGSNLAKMEQQAQSSWNENDDLQQSQLTQQTQDFGTIDQNKPDSFYQERHSSYQNSAQRAQVNEAGNTDSESVVAATVTEITTPKPGFWKSVGSKFVGAKDKVTSWFSSS
ncbi:uncharacterized protein LOC105385509 [Plutella xylostella]|uniref:uncharacterized protein LOC105385509 n=1 Tax=Plutella xylostella TaxID=51655 RepID=UPI002032C713|nr:uncharacterized protein LOC105385509 [Plutella xylostella]